MHLIWESILDSFEVGFYRAAVPHYTQLHFIVNSFIGARTI